MTNVLPHACRCGARWSGYNTAHCAADCHLTFSTVSAFREHRRNGECFHPADVGLELRQRPGYSVWGRPEADATGRTRGDGFEVLS